MPLRDFEPVVQKPISPEEVDWSRRGHLRSTYEFFYRLGPGVTIWGYRPLAEVLGRPRETARRHVQGLEAMGLLEVTAGYGGLEDYEASQFRLGTPKEVPLSLAQQSAEQPDESPAASPGKTGHKPVSDVEVVVGTTDDVEEVPPTDVYHSVSRRARSLDPEIYFGDERRWQRGALGEGARRIARAWLAKGKPTFTSPEMASWTGQDATTVRRLMNRMDAPEHGISAAQDRATRRWTLGVKPVISPAEFDGLLDLVHAPDGPPSQLVAELLRATHTDDEVRRDRVHAVERKRHRELTLADWAKRNGNGRDWILPADPSNGRPFRGVKPFGTITRTVDDNGWLEQVEVLDPRLRWVDRQVEITLPSGAPYTATVPEARYELGELGSAYERPTCSQP